MKNKFKEKRIKTAISAHNGFTAKVVSTMGFDYIWASSLEISSSMAVPDASIVSFHRTKDIVENIIQSSEIPVILDCDTGYGSAINVYYYFKQLKDIGVKAVCLEDNVFPKQNSFYAGRRALEDIDVFATKVKVAKAIFNGPDELVIARTEALINSYGVDEAHKRAKVYKDAGADLIMPHTKQKTPNELFEFAGLWDHSIPLVSVPSTYSDVHIDDLKENGIELVIYANHTIRAMKKALEEVLPSILIDGSTKNIEGRISPLKEILELSGESIVKSLEKEYLL